MANSKYEPVIGLEIHVQLLTNTKLFCKCSTSFGAEPNSQVCPICLGMPGVLPVLNEKAIEFGIKLALATHCKIAPKSIFARKNYFYPDLPKGYQISQFENPLCQNGYIDIELDQTIKRVRLTRIHLEEDAGKSIHAEEFVNKNQTFVDLNRCGVPLLEIVSEPDIRSPHEAYLFLNKLKQLVQYLDICDGNMEEGSLRCDANISVRPENKSELGVKTELKNMNSFKGVERALEFEINRQINELNQGNKIEQVTLMWDDKANNAIPMRSKEMAHDYRYFPDPDLVPVLIKQSTIDEIRETLPELPDIKIKRFISDYNLPEYDANVLTEVKDIANYFDDVVKQTKDPKLTSNWIMSDVLRTLNEQKIKITEFPIEAFRLSELINLIKKQIINAKTGKSIFIEMLTNNESPSKIVSEKGLNQVSDESEISTMIDDVLNENNDEVVAYVAGKDKLFSFFVGQIMRRSKGRANPKLVNQILKQKLDSKR